MCFVLGPRVYSSVIVSAKKQGDIKLRKSEEKGGKSEADARGLAAGHL